MSRSEILAPQRRGALDAEYSWQATENFRMRFGLRYRDVTRDFDPSVIQNFLPGTHGQISKTVSSVLPSLDVT